MNILLLILGVPLGLYGLWFIGEFILVNTLSISDCEK